MQFYRSVEATSSDITLAVPDRVLQLRDEGGVGGEFFGGGHDQARGSRPEGGVVNGGHRGLLGAVVNQAEAALAAAGELDIDLRQQLAVEQSVVGGARVRR